ncbi:magnesium/cobalt transporter CorA [Fontimonas sp. SYSU GA230001]|uniref:magnesium/cobalt transporter CorA n=1 Tax=Fontimonas sp. SYSU GA230001 TaxID=3142450 RepID=UPI0032B59CA2
MLVSCTAYQNGHKLADIAPGEIHDYVGRPDCFVWVALKDADAAELETMRTEFGLHPLAVEDASHGHQRPKLEEYGDSLFAALHLIELADGQVHEGELAIFVGRHYVLTVRNRAERGLTEVRRRSETEPELLRHGPGFVLYAIMDAVVDRYFPVLHAIESELETIEERLFAEKTSPSANIRDLYTLKRKLVILKHAVGPLPEALARLYGGRVPPLAVPLQDYFRDVHDHVQRLNQALDTLRDTIATALSVNLSLINLQESETMKRLAAYAALIAVPTMIAGIYGMNFEAMPELHWRYGYPVVLAVMVAVDIWLYLRLRKARWI